MACARFARPMGVFWRRSHWAKVARVWSSTSRRMADLRPCIVPSSRVWDRSYGRSVCTCPVFPPLFNGGLYLAYLILSLLLGSATLLYALLSKGNGPSRSAKRFMWAKYSLGQYRTVLVIGLADCVTLISIAWYYSDFVSASYLWAALVYYGLSAVLLVVILTLGVLTLPLPILGEDQSNLTGLTLSTPLIGTSVWALVGYLPILVCPGM